LVAETERLFAAVHCEFVQAANRGDTARHARLDAIEEKIIARLLRRIALVEKAEAVQP
jgi:hypothetical protein